MALSESLRKQIADLVASNRVVLFLKGTPQMPHICSAESICGS